MRYDHLDMLPIRAFQPIGKRMTLEGGGGDGDGGGGGTTTSTSYSTNLPEYAQPYYQELLKQTGREVFATDAAGNVTGMKPGTNLPQQTVAGFNPIQQQVQQNVAGMTRPGEFGQSATGLTSGQQLGYGTALQGLGQAFMYNPQSAQTFGSAQASQYMNPYQQNVTDIALREAQQQGALQRQAGMLGSIGRGTFGGARQALMQAEGNRNLMRTMGDIQAQGSQQAFQNAQQQFNADQQRQQQAQQYAATLGSQLGLAGMQGGIDTSKALGALGTEQQQADLARLTAQGAVGAEQQALGQKQADIDYQNRMAQQNFGRQQLQFYSDILRGNAGALGSTQVQYTPTPSTASQVAGLGLAGLGLAKALT
jgi:hypothetical protein